MIFTKHFLLATIFAGSVFASQPLAPITSGFQTLATVIDLKYSLAESASYLNTVDGQPLLVLKVGLPGAKALRLHLGNVRLPEGSELLIYGLDAAGQATAPQILRAPLAETDLWTMAFPGTTAVFELQVTGDSPADLPFEIIEAQSVTPANTEAIEPTVTFSETKSGIFRGMPVTYQIRDGLAYLEGDIVLGPTEELERDTFTKGRERNSVTIAGDQHLWPDGSIPYVISSNISDQDKISDAIDYWNKTLSGTIKFRSRKKEDNYIFITRGSSCSAYVGMQGYGAQIVSIADNCTVGNVIHELGHAVGLWHEQSRNDRDQHIRVLWENIDPNALFNFNQAGNGGNDRGAYDFGSIMHYPAFAYSVNGKPTIETIPAGMLIGQRTALSAGDIAAVRQLYGNVAPPPPPVVVPPVTVPAPPSTSHTAPVTITTNIPGKMVTVDGAYTATPATFNWTIGSTHGIYVTDWSAGGTDYKFVGWSDGGQRWHTITTPSQPATYRADFTSQYQLSTSVQPAGAGSVSVSPASPNGVYPLNTALTVSAVPAPGYCFASWSGAISATPSTTSLILNKTSALQANFVSGSLTLTSSSATAPAWGALLIVGVNGNTGCLWRTIESASWVSVVTGASGSGSGVVMLMVGTNTTGASRQSTVTIAGSTYVITQAAK